MASVTELATMLQELDDNLVSCMRCGLCQAVCPVYGATLKEADVARGKIALLEDLANEMIRDPEGVNEKLNRCLLCGSCQANCSSGVHCMDIFFKARTIIAEYMGFSPIKKAIFRGMLQHPKLFNALMSVGSKTQGLLVKDASKVVGTSCSSILSPLIGDRHFAKLAKTSFHSEVPSLNTPAGKSGLKVAFFPGCVSDKMLPNLPKACMKVFEHHGVGVFIPPLQSCCGIPALASGDKKAYDKLVARNMELFTSEQFDYLITPCATCTATIKEVWPELMAGYPADLQQKITALHDKVMDISAFVVDVLKADMPSEGKAGANAKTITYHDPCHLSKSLGVRAQPRKLIGANPNYTFKEMAESDRCCGSGGSFTLYHYDLSKDIGQRKRDNIVAAKAETVATSCPACMMQLMDTLSQNNDPVDVRHVIEVYAETL